MHGETVKLLKFVKKMIKKSKK